MPPKVKFTSNEIIEAAAKIKRTKGIDAVTASHGYALTIDLLLKLGKSRYNKNPNPIPIGTRFGFLLFGAANGT